MTSRERFEAAIVEYARDEGYERPEYVLERNSRGDYSTTWVRGAWIGWQANEPKWQDMEPVAQVIQDGATVRLEWVSVQAAHNAKPGPLYAPKEKA